MASLAVQREFEVYGDVLEWVEVFKYLGRRLSMTDGDAPAIRAQLTKSRIVRAWVSAVLQGENTSP